MSEPLTPDDVAQIIEGIEHFIMNGDPLVDEIWQPYVEKLRAHAATHARLRAALEGLAIDAATSGASPRSDGGMTPPLWHMRCKLCNAQWHGTQWKQPREHPESDCVLSLTKMETP